MRTDEFVPEPTSTISHSITIDPASAQSGRSSRDSTQHAAAATARARMTHAGSRAPIGPLMVDACNGSGRLTPRLRLRAQAESPGRDRRVAARSRPHDAHRAPDADRHAREAHRRTNRPVHGDDHQQACARSRSGASTAGRVNTCARQGTQQRADAACARSDWERDERVLPARPTSHGAKASVRHPAASAVNVSTRVDPPHRMSTLDTPREKPRQGACHCWPTRRSRRVADPTVCVATALPLAASFHQLRLSARG